MVKAVLGVVSYKCKEKQKVYKFLMTFNFTRGEIMKTNLLKNPLQGAEKISREIEKDKKWVVQLSQYYFWLRYLRYIPFISVQIQAILQKCKIK